MIRLKERKQKEREEKKINPLKKNNNSIMRITYLFIGLFVLLLANFTYFMAVESQDAINNSYNRRQDLLAETIKRGQILSRDGQILAESLEDDHGNVARYYSYKDVFCHVVGRVENGKTGLESTEGFTLLTSSISPVRKAINELKGVKSEGDNLVTTLSTDLQKTAYSALGKHDGAVVVMNATSGEILAMVSKPAYDPNKIITEWDALTKKDDNESALLNRATQGLYTPGSTFKIVTALAYMRQHSDYEAFRYHCDGINTMNDTSIRCSNNKKHGDVTFEQAFAKSCNGAFVEMAKNLSLEELAKTADSLLFNTPFQFPFSVKPSSFVLNQADANMIPQTVIGQGLTQVTPMHMALIGSAIANDGVLMKPYLVDRVESSTGRVIKKNLPEVYAELMSSSEAKALKQLMEAVVTEGTATALQSKHYQAAGKTGTAQIGEGKKEDSWFVGYAGKDKPEIAVSVVVEEVGSGSKYAVPIAKKIFEEYYD